MEKEEIIETPVEQVEEIQLKKKKSALKGWYTFLFVLSCIATIVLGMSIFLPFFIIIFGLISGLAWFALVAILSIITVGLIWTVDTFKEFNAGWMEMNNTIFNSAEVISNKVIEVLPIIAISGGSILAITWALLIIGLTTENEHKKFYKGMLVAFIIISVLYIVFSILTILINNSN